MRDPTGNEWSGLIDPPLEGPGGNAGLTYDTLLPYHGNATIQNTFDEILFVTRNVSPLFGPSFSSQGCVALRLDKRHV